MDLNHHDASSIRRDENFPTVANHVKKEELLRHKLEAERVSKRELVERLNAEKEEIKHKAKLVVDMFKQKVAETDRELTSSKLSIETLQKRSQLTNDLLTVHLSKWRIWNDYLQAQDNVDNFAEFLLQQPMRFISLCGSSKDITVAKPCELPALMISELDAIIKYITQPTTDIDLNAIPYLTVVPVCAQRALKEQTLAALDKGNVGMKQDNLFASPSRRRPLKQLNMNTEMRDVEQSQSALSPAARVPVPRGSAAKPPKSNKSGCNAFSIFEDNATQSVAESCNNLVSESADAAVVGALQARITSLEGEISLLQAANSRQVGELAAERAAREAAEQQCAQLSSLQTVVEKLDVKVQKLRSNLEKSKAETAEAREALQRERDVYFNVELRHTTEREKLTSAAMAQVEEQARELERLQALLAVPNPAVIALEQQLHVKDSELSNASETLFQQASSLFEMREELRANQERFAELMREQEEASALNIAELRDEVSGLQCENAVLVGDVLRQSTEIASTSHQLLQTAKRLADSEKAHATALQDASAHAQQLQLVIATRDAEDAKLHRTVQEHLEAISTLERSLRAVEDAGAVVNSSLQETATGLASARDALASEVDARALDAERAAAQVAQLEMELSQLRAQLAAVEARASLAAQDASSMIADLSLAFMKRTAELGDATGKLAAIDACLNDVRQQSELHAGQLAEAEEKVEDLQGLVAAKSDLIADLETEVASLQEENSAARTASSEAIAELQSQLWAATTASATRESDIVQRTSQLELSVAEWQSKYHQREEGLGAATAFIEQLQHQLEIHAARVGQLEAAIAEQTASSSLVSAERTQLEQRVQDLQAACREACEKLAQQETELSDVRGDAEKLSDYCAELLEQVQERESALHEALESRQTLLQLRDDLHEQNLSLTEQLQSAQAVIEEAAVELSDLGRDHALEKTALEQTIGNLSAQSVAQELAHGAFVTEQQLLLQARSAAFEELQASAITSSTQLEATVLRAQRCEQELSQLVQEISNMKSAAEDTQTLYAATTSALELQVRDLSCALDAKTVALDEVSGTLVDTQSNLQCCSERAESLQAVVSDLQDRYEALREEQSLARDEQIALLKNQLEDSAAQLAAVRLERQQAESVLSCELASLRDTIASLETAAAAASSRHVDELTELRGAYEEKDRALQEAAAAKQVVLEQLRASEDMGINVRIQLDQATSELSAAQTELLNNRAGDHERSEHITSLQEALLERELQVLQLTGALVDASESLHSTGAARASAEQQLQMARDQLVAALEASDSEQLFRCDEINSLRRSIDERERAMVDLDSCAQQLQSRCADLEQQLLEEKKSVRAQQQELESTKIAMQELVGQLENREVHIASLFEELRMVEEQREVERQKATLVQTAVLSCAELTVSAYQLAAEEDHHHRTEEIAALRNQLQTVLRALLEVDMCARDCAEQLAVSTRQLAAFAVKYDEDICALREQLESTAEQQALDFAEQARSAAEVEAARMLLQSQIADNTSAVAHLTTELERCRAAVDQKVVEIASLTEIYQTQEVQNSLKHAQEVAILNSQAVELEERLRQQTLHVAESQAALKTAVAQIQNCQHMLADSHAAAEEDCRFRSCELASLRIQALGAQRAILELDACVVECTAENVHLHQLNCELHSQLDSASTELAQCKDSGVLLKREVEVLTAQRAELQVAANATATAHHEKTVELSAEIVSKQSAVDALHLELAEERTRSSTAALEAETIFSELQRSNIETVGLSERRQEDLTALQANLTAMEAQLTVLSLTASEAGSQLVESRAVAASLEESLRSQACQIAELAASLALREIACCNFEVQVAQLELSCQARQQEILAAQAQASQLEADLLTKEEALLEAQLNHADSVACQEAQLRHLEHETEQLRVHLSAKEYELSALTTQHAETADALSTLTLQYQQTSEEASVLASEVATLHHQASECAQKHGEALATLRDCADASRCAVVDLRTQLSTAVAKIASLDSQLLTTQATATEDTIAAENRLHEAASVHATETAAHNALVDDLRMKHSALQADLAEANELSSCLIAKLEASSQEYMLLSAALTNEKDIKLALEQQFITTSDAVASLQSELSQAQNNIIVLAARCAEAHEQVAAPNVAVESLQYQLEQAGQAHINAIEAHVMAVSVLQDQIASLECERAVRILQMQVLQDAATATQQDLSDALAAARRAEQDLKTENEASISLLTAEFGDAQERMAALVAKGNQSTATIAEMQTTLAEKLSQLECVTAASSGYSATIQSLEQRVLRLHGDLDDAVLQQQAHQSSCDGALKTLREEIDRKSEIILTLESQIMDKSTALDALSLEMKELHLSAAERTAKLQAAIQDASIAADAATSQHDEAISAMQAAVAALRASDNERLLAISALQAALSDKTAEFERLAAAASHAAQEGTTTVQNLEQTISQLQSEVHLNSQQLRSEQDLRRVVEAQVQQKDKEITAYLLLLETLRNELQTAQDSHEVLVGAQRNEIEESSRTIAALESKVCLQDAALASLALELQTVRRAAEVQCSEHSAVVDELRLAIESSGLEIGVLSAAGSKAALSIAQLEIDLVAKTHELDSLTTATSKTALDSASAVRKLEQEVADLQGELHDTTMLLHSERSLKIAADSQLEETSGTIETMRVAIQEMKVMHQAEFYSQAELVEQKEESIAAMEFQLSGKCAALDALSLELQQLQQFTAEQAQKYNATVQDMVASTEGMKSDHANAVSGLLADMATAQKEITRLSAMATESNEVIASLQQDLTGKINEHQYASSAAASSAESCVQLQTQLREKVADIQGLERIVQNLQAGLDSTVAERDSVCTASNELQMSLAVAQHALLAQDQSTSTTIASLVSEVATLQTALDTAQASTAATEQKISSITADRAALQRQLDVALVESAKLQESTAELHAKLKSELEVTAAEAAQLRAQLDEKLSLITDLTDTNAAADVEHVFRCNQLQAMIHEQTQSADLAAQHLSEANAQVAELQRQLEVSCTASLYMEQRIIALQASTQVAEHASAQAQALIQDLQHTSCEALSAHAAQLSTLNEQLSVHSTSVSCLQVQLADKESDVMAISERVDRLHQEKAAWVVLMENREAANALARQQLESQLQVLSVDMVSVSARWELSAQEMQSLRQQLGEREQSMQVLEDALAFTKATAMEESALHYQEIIVLREQMSAGESTTIQLNKAITDLTAELSHLQAMHQELIGQRDVLEAERDTLCGNLGVQCQDSKAAEVALQAQVDALRAELEGSQVLVQEKCGHIDEQATHITELEIALSSKEALVEECREQLTQRDADLAASMQRLADGQTAHDLELSTAREQLCASTASVFELQAIIIDRTAALQLLKKQHEVALQELVGLEAEKQELSAQVQKLSTTNISSLESAQALQRELSLHVADVAAAKAALAESTDAIEVLELDLLTKHTHIIELQKTIAELSDASTATAAEKELAASSAAAEILSLSSLLQQSEAARVECQQQLAAATAVHTAEVADLKIVIHERESVAQEINTRFLSMMETADDLKRRIHEISQLEQQLRQEVSEKTALLEGLQVDNGVLAAQDHFRSKELADMQARLHIAEAEAASCKQQVHVRTVESVDLTVTIRHKQDMIQELTATVEQTEFQLQQLLFKEAEFAGLLTEVNGKLQKSEEKAAKLDIQLMSQANSVVELKTKLTTAQKALEDERRARVAEREDYVSKAQENEFVIQELSSRVEDSKTVISLVEEKLVETEALYVNVCEELNALRTQYHEIASRPASTHHELELAAMAETIRDLEQKFCHELEGSAALRSQLESLQATMAHQAQVIAQRDQELHQVVTDHAHLSAHVYEIKSMEVKVTTLEELLATAQHELLQYHEAHQEAESEETESEVAASEEIRTLQVNLVRLRAKVASKSKQVLLLNQQMLRDRQNFQKLKKSLVKLDGLKSTVFANNYNPAVPAPPLPVNQVSELYHLGMDVATKKLETERQAEIEEQCAEMALVRHNLAQKLAEIENAKFENLSVADECIHQGSMNHLSERITQLQEELGRQVTICQETNRQLVAMRAAKSDSEGAHYLKLSKKVVECTALRAALDHTQKHLIKLKNAQTSGAATCSNGVTGHEDCVARTTKLETQLQVMTRMQQEGAAKFDKAVRTLKALEARGSSLSKEVVAASAEIQYLNRKLQKPTALEMWEEIEFFA